MDHEDTNLILEESVKVFVVTMFNRAINPTTSSYLLYLNLLSVACKTINPTMYTRPQKYRCIGGREGEKGRIARQS